MVDMRGRQNDVTLHYSEFPLFHDIQDDIGHRRKQAGIVFHEDDQYSGLCSDIIFGIWLAEYGRLTTLTLNGNEQAFFKDLSVLRMDGVLDFQLCYD